MSESTEPVNETPTECVTAVLLVETHEGTILPITNLPQVKMSRVATPHHVLRMCVDVSDQISSVRAVGETLRNVDLMLGKLKSDLSEEETSTSDISEDENNEQ